MAWDEKLEITLDRSSSSAVSQSACLPYYVLKHVYSLGKDDVSLCITSGSHCLFIEKQYEGYSSETVALARNEAENWKTAYNIEVEVGENPNGRLSLKLPFVFCNFDGEQNVIWDITCWGNKN